MRGISWLAGELLASQEGLCSMQLVTAYPVALSELYSWQKITNTTDVLSKLKFLQQIFCVWLLIVYQMYVYTFLTMSTNMRLKGGTEDKICIPLSNCILHFRGDKRVSNQWHIERGLGVQPPPPPKFRRPSKIVPNSTRLWKLLKIAEFRTPTPQDVWKKGSKILKLPMFAIVLH